MYSDRVFLVIISSHWILKYMCAELLTLKTFSVQL